MRLGTSFPARRPLRKREIVLREPPTTYQGLRPLRSPGGHPPRSGGLHPTRIPSRHRPRRKAFRSQTQEKSPLEPGIKLRGVGDLSFLPDRAGRRVHPGRAGDVADQGDPRQADRGYRWPQTDSGAGCPVGSGGWTYSGYGRGHQHACHLEAPGVGISLRTPRFSTSSVFHRLVQCESGFQQGVQGEPQGVVGEAGHLAPRGHCRYHQ